MEIFERTPRCCLQETLWEEAPARADKSPLCLYSSFSFSQAQINLAGGLPVVNALCTVTGDRLQWRPSHGSLSLLKA